MTGVFVLILTIQMGSSGFTNDSGRGGGTALAVQEFDSETACRRAAATWIADVRQRLQGIHSQAATCIAKGDPQ